MSDNSPTNILKILQGVTCDAKKWVDKLEKRKTIGIKDKWISRVDNFLKDLPSDQINLVTNKFINCPDRFLLFDKLAEILVAVEYQNEQPQFLSDNLNGKTPDIFLKKSQQYIEVKNFNYSNKYKIFSKENPTYYLERNNTSIDDLRVEDQRKYKQILKYIKEKIDIGIQQLSGEKGFIYFFYSIDSEPFFFKDVDEKSFDLTQDIKKHYSQKKIKVVCKQFALK